MANDQARQAVAEPIVPDEVRRIRLRPGEHLIVRVGGGFTPRQMREYQEHLQEYFPENQVLVLHAEEIITESATGEA